MIRRRKAMAPIASSLNARFALLTVVSAEESIIKRFTGEKFGSVGQERQRKR